MSRWICCAALLLSAASLRPIDPFVAQRDAAAALNSGSRRFTIAFAGNRRSFRVGEEIPIVFSYDNLRRSFVTHSESFVHFAQPVLDRTAGTAPPLADFARAALYMPAGVCCGVEGGVVGGAASGRIIGLEPDANGIPTFIFAPPPPPPPPPPPVVVTFALNDGLRFDAPGRYRLYMVDNHDAERGPADHPWPPLISNIVAFDITEREEARDQQEVNHAVGVLDTSADRAARLKAARILGLVGSPRAISEMARRLWRWPGDHLRVENFQFEAGLFAVRDRDAAIAAMERDVDDPQRPISIWYLRELAALRVTQKHAGRLKSGDKHRALLAADQRRVRALSRAGVRHDGLMPTVHPTASEPAWHLPNDVSVDTDERFISVGLNDVDNRRAYFLGGARVPFSGLGSVLSRFPAGTAFRWEDELDYSLSSWYLDRDAEFLRVEAVVRRHGMSLTRSP